MRHCFSMQCTLDCEVVMYGCYLSFTVSTVCLSSGKKNQCFQ